MGLGREQFCGIALWLTTAGCLSIAGLDDEYTLGAGGANATGSNDTAVASGATAGSTGGAAVSSSAASTGGGGGLGCTGVHEYVATVADCIDLDTPDPDYCESSTAPGEMAIDTDFSGSGEPRHVFLRFDLDPTVADSPLASIRLRLVAGAVDGSDTDECGEVWRVMPFVQPDLSAGDPGNVDSTPLASSMGATTIGMPVDWSLPTDIVDGGSVYLAVRPLTTNTGHYVNIKGAGPERPRLFVTCLE